MRFTTNTLIPGSALSAAGNGPLIKTRDGVSHNGIVVRAHGNGGLTGRTLRLFVIGGLIPLGPAGGGNDERISVFYRAWRDFIKQRNTPHADAEIREFAQQVLTHLKEIAPNSVSDLEVHPPARVQDL